MKDFLLIVLRSGIKRLHHPRSLHCCDLQDDNFIYPLTLKFCCHKTEQQWAWKIALSYALCNKVSKRKEFVTSYLYAAISLDTYNKLN